MKYWRNGKVDTSPPVLLALTRCALVIPLVAVYVRFYLDFQEGSRAWGILAGVLVWFITFVIQLRAIFSLEDDKLYINSYGIRSTSVGVDNIKNIRISGWVPMGAILDIKTKKNLGWREFIFLGKVKKSTLYEYFEDSGIEII